MKYINRLSTLILGLTLLIHPWGDRSHAFMATDSPLIPKVISSDNQSLRFVYEEPSGANIPNQLKWFVAIPPSGQSELLIDSYTLVYTDSNGQEVTVKSGESNALPVNHGELKNLLQFQPLGFVRDYRVARLSFYPRKPLNLPNVGNVAARFTRIEFEIPVPQPAGLFLPAGPRKTGIGLEQVLERALVNYESANNYRALPVLPEVKTPESMPGLAFPSFTDASIPRLKVNVTERGLYRVSADSLKESKLTGKPLQVWRNGKPVASQLLSSGDLVFTGEPSNTIYSKTGVYWVTFADKSNTRTITDSKSLPLTGNSASRSVIRESAVLNIERKYDPYLRTPQGKYWFMDILEGGKTLEIPIPVSTPDTPELFKNPPQNPDITITMMAKPESPKNEPQVVILLLGNDTIARVNWTGRSFYTLATTFPFDKLSAPSTTFTLKVLPMTEGKVEVAVGTVTLNYDRKLDLNTGPILLQPEKTKLDKSAVIPLSFTGVNQNQEVVLWSVSPEGDISRIPSKWNGNTNTLDAVIDSQKTVWVSRTDMIPMAAAVKVQSETNLRDSKTVSDSIYITHPTLLDGTKQMAEYRQSQGISSRVVSVEDIYDQFSYGVLDPRAIRNYLRWLAYYGAKPFPAYVVLVGDANWDYTDNLKTGTPVLVPTYRAPEQVLINEDQGSNEDFYIDLIGETDREPWPDMVCARISVESNEQMLDVLAKMKDHDVRYELGPWRMQALLATDDGFESDGLEAANRYLSLWVEPVFLRQSDFPYLPHQKFGKDSGRRQAPKATEKLMELMDSGIPLMIYTGHAGGGVWSHERLFLGGEHLKGSDINRLTNMHRFNFVFAMSCLNGYFDFPMKPWQSITPEELLRRRDRGSVASLVPGGKGGTSQHLNFGQGFAESFYKYRDSRIGEAVFQSKINYLLNTSDFSQSEQFVLIGDPFAHFPLPKENIEIQTQPRVRFNTGAQPVKITCKAPFNSGNIIVKLYTTATTPPIQEVQGVLKQGVYEASLNLPEGETALIRAYAWDSISRTDGAGGVMMSFINPVLNMDYQPVLSAPEMGQVTLRHDWKMPVNSAKVRLTVGKSSQDVGYPNKTWNTGEPWTISFTGPAKSGIYPMTLKFTGEMNQQTFTLETEVGIAIGADANNTFPLGVYPDEIQSRPNPAVPGDAVRFTVPLYHYGNTTRDNQVWQLKDSSGTKVAEGRLTPLLPYSTVTLTPSWTVPATFLADGKGPSVSTRLTLWLGDQLQGEIPVKVQTGPQLAFVSMKYEPEAPQMGETIYFKVKVKNQGMTSGRNVSLVAYMEPKLPNANALSNIAMVPNPMISEIKPGETIDSRLRWDPPITALGNQTVRVVINPYVTGSEDSSRWINTVVNIRKNAELIIVPGSFEVTSGTLQPGQTVEVKLQIQNIGDTRAIPLYPWSNDLRYDIEVKFYSRNGNDKDTVIGQPVYFAPLNPGQKTEVTANIQLPDKIRELVVKVDSDNEVLEMDEFNNQANLTVQ